MSPPEGGLWESLGAATDVPTCVYMPDGLTVQVPVRLDQTAADLLSAACKVGCERTIFLTAVVKFRFICLF